MDGTQTIRCLCISDIHGDTEHLQAILDQAPESNLIVLGGDLTNFGTPSAAREVVELAQNTCPQVVAVAGNCDSKEIDDLLDEIGVSVFRRSQSFGALGLYGVSAMPPWRGTMYELSEEDILASLESGQNHLNATNPDCNIQMVVAHPPPFNTSVDTTSRGEHVGSRSVREWIIKHQPHFVICGHIHEARGVDQIGTTCIINCGPAFLGHYAMVELTITPAGDVIVESELKTATK